MHEYLFDIKIIISNLETRARTIYNGILNFVLGKILPDGFLVTTRLSSSHVLFPEFSSVLSLPSFGCFEPPSSSSSLPSSILSEKYDDLSSNVNDNYID